MVLGGTSLLGGRGFPLPTVIAAIFLQQLIQLVSVLGVSPAISPLVQAAALAIGISLYTARLAGDLQVRPPALTHACAGPDGMIQVFGSGAGRARQHVARKQEERKMKSRTRIAAIFGSVAAVSMVLAGCGSSGGQTNGPGGAVTHVTGAPSWCGTKKIDFALLDGFGGNSWRLVTTASGKDEAAKCPSVTKFRYADGQGNTQKAISDIKGMVSSGVNAMVVFPDAGKAVLPALTSAFKAGVVTVPYRVDPGGKAGVNYDKWIGDDFANDGNNWAAWIKKNVPNGGNVLFLGGPAGNSQSTTEYEALRKNLPASYKFIGQTPFQPTNWDPTLTQQLLTADIAKYPKIDVIVSDFGPTLVSSLPLFPKSSRNDPGAGHV